jgi:PAS domain S-box-containing protein
MDTPLAKASPSPLHGDRPLPGLLLGESGIAILRRTLALGFIGALTTGLNVVNFNALQARDARVLAIPLACACAYGLLSKVRVRPAILTLIWGIGLSILAISFFAVGVLTPALVFLPILCVTSAWLLGLRSAIALGLTSLAVIFFQVIAVRYGYTPPNEPRNALAYALVYLFAFVGALIVATRSMGSYQTQLQNTVNLSLDLQRQVQELRQSGERFVALFKANPVPSSTNGPDGRIVDVNDAWVALTGISAAQAVDKTPREIGIWDDTDERKAVNQSMIATGRVHGKSITLTTAGGVPKPFLVYIAPVSSHGTRCLVTSLLDQSDRYAAQAAQEVIHQALEARVTERTVELSRALDRLRTTQADLVQAENLASLGAMVAGITHELNTPIGTAVTVASTLQARISDLRHLVAQDGLRRSTLTEFLADSEEMADLILRSMERATSQIRSFKQTSVDRTSERRRQFALQDLVHDIVLSTRPTLRQRRITIVQAVAADIVCDTLADPIGQVLTNLIQNASVHGFAGRDTGTITIRSHQKPSENGTLIVLNVQDDGVGMSNHTRHHAFDPFYTTRMGQGGSGLGLSVSHRLASAVLGGSLAIESTPNAGSCFTFCFLQTLPAEPA